MLKIKFMSARILLASIFMFGYYVVGQGLMHARIQPPYIVNIDVLYIVVAMVVFMPVRLEQER